MALSLSPHQLKQVIHTPLFVPSKPHQPFSTPRHFSTVVHDKPNNEALSMGSTESSSKPPSSSSQILPDLPSWTPLRTLGGDTDYEVDQLSTKSRATGSAMTQIRESPTKAQATVENTTVAAQPTSKSLSSAKPLKAKNARFDGVLITTKPKSHRKYSFYSKHPSTTHGTSLVDALARTFDANRHPEDLFAPPSRTALSRYDGTSTARMEVETSEPEEDLVQLNSRLARKPSKPLKIKSVPAYFSEANSEDATPPRQDIPQSDRPIKRLKAVQYESNAAFIDAALGTVQAPISWDAELDFITRGDEFVISPVVSLGDQMTVDDVDHAPESSETAPSALARAGNEWSMPTGGGPKVAFLSPYLSRGAKFRERLGTIFGENTTVRTDRGARPRRVEFDYVSFDLDGEQSPVVSGSTVSISSASSREEEDASAIPSTRVTSQSPGVNGADQSRGDQVEVGPVTKPPFVANEAQMGAWIAALQRLVKGKVYVKEEDLETLSIILAEIESVKGGLGHVSLSAELLESVKQLSKLREIPFGDRNMLRQRAENIFQTWPSSMEANAS